MNKRSIKSKEYLRIEFCFNKSNFIVLSQI